MTQYKILAIFLFFGLGTAVFAQEESNTNNADAVYENVVYEYILNEDSSTIFNYSHKLKLLSYYSFQRRYGESFIVYDPNHQELKIKTSETTMADGTKVQSPENAFNKVVPRFAGHAAPYMHLREMVVTHTGLEKNATIDFSYSIETGKDFLPGLQAKVFLRKRSPVKNFEVRVVVPKGKEINYHLANSKVKPDINNTARWTVYKWNFNNVPLLEVEPTQPPWGEFVPTLYISSASPEYVKEHLLGEENAFKPNEKMKTKVTELIKDKTSGKEKGLALANYVKNNVGLMDCNPLEYGYKPLTAIETFQNNVGSALDKAVLLKTMLTEAGLDTEMACASSYRTNKEDISLLTQYSSFPIYFEGEDMFLCTRHEVHQKYPAGADEKVYCLLSKEATPKRFNDLTYKDNAINFQGELTISDDMKISGKGNLEMGGFFRHELEEKCVGKSVKKLFHHPNIKAVADSSSIKIARDEPTTCDVTFNQGKALEKEGEVYVFPIPAATSIADMFHLPLSSAPRQTPLEVKEPYMVEYSWEINYPEKFNTFYKKNEDDIEMKNEVGSISCSMEDKGGKIELIRSLSIEKQVIEPGNYKDFYALIKNWKDKRFIHIYFEE